MAEYNMGVLLQTSLGIRIIAWWRSTTRDPWEGVDGFDAAAYFENENILCFSCCCPIHYLNNFCPECAAPIGPYCWYHPWWRVFAGGHAARRLVSKPIACWVFATVWVISFGQIVVHLSVIGALCIYGSGNQREVILSGLLLGIMILYELTFAYRTTMNYYHHRDLELD